MTHYENRKLYVLFHILHVKKLENLSFVRRRETCDRVGLGADLCAKKVIVP